MTCTDGAVNEQPVIENEQTSLARSCLWLEINQQGLIHRKKISRGCFYDKLSEHREGHLHSVNAVDYHQVGTKVEIGEIRKEHKYCISKKYQWGFWLQLVNVILQNRVGGVLIIGTKVEEIVYGLLLGGGGGGIKTPLTVDL